MLNVYISGPMSGYPDFNDAAFTAAEEMIAEAGHNPVNPHRLDVEHGYVEGTDLDDWSVSPGARAQYLVRDFRAMTGCDSIYMLDGWGQSLGAQCELVVAVMMDMPVITFQTPMPLERALAWAWEGAWEHVFALV